MPTGVICNNSGETYTIEFQYEAKPISVTLAPKERIRIEDLIYLEEGERERREITIKISPLTGGPKITAEKVDVLYAYISCLDKGRIKIHPQENIPPLPEELKRARMLALTSFIREQFNGINEADKKYACESNGEIFILCRSGLEQYESKFPFNFFTREDFEEAARSIRDEMIAKRDEMIAKRDRRLNQNPPLRKRGGFFSRLIKSCFSAAS